MPKPSRKSTIPADRLAAISGAGSATATSTRTARGKGGRPKALTSGSRRMSVIFPRDLWQDVARFAGYLQLKTGRQFSISQALAETLVTSPLYLDWKKKEKNVLSISNA